MTSLTKNNPSKRDIFFRLPKRQVRKDSETIRKGKNKLYLRALFFLGFGTTPPKLPVLAVKIHLVTVYVILKCFWKLPLKSVTYQLHQFAFYGTAARWVQSCTNKREQSCSLSQYSQEGKNYIENLVELDLKKKLFIGIPKWSEGLISEKMVHRNYKWEKGFISAYRL